MNSPAVPHSATSASAKAATAGEFLTFTLGQEEYGVDILKVQEIRGYDAVTRLPDAPEYDRRASINRAWHRSCR